MLCADMDDTIVVLQAALYGEKPAAGDDQALTLIEFRMNDNVTDSGFIFKR